MITFKVPAVPIAQPRQRSAMVAGHMRNYTPAKHPVNVFKAAVQLAASQAYDGPPLAGPLSLQATFVMPRPKNKIWKRRPMPRYHHAIRPDADNLLKALKDSLSGVLWRDDAQIAQVECCKWVASGEEQPHAEVWVDTLEVNDPV